MAKKKKQQNNNNKKPRRHRAGRVREPLAAQLEVLAARRATDWSEELNRAVRELLEREKLWPPPEGGAAAPAPQ